MRRAALSFHFAALVPLLGVSACVRDGPRAHARMEWVRVADDARGFSLASSGRPFTPWGFNYDHDEHLRLLEDYWDAEWSKVEEDFDLSVFEKDRITAPSSPPAPSTSISRFTDAMVSVAGLPSNSPALT